MSAIPLLPENMWATMFGKLTQRCKEQYNNPTKGADQIKKFIAQYNLKNEWKGELNDYATWNDFFKRKLKPGARVVNPEENVLVSPADCRLHIFPNVNSATRLWIKGNQFTLVSMLGNDDLAKAYLSANRDVWIYVCRLAPQDYHRFHMPTSGILGPAKQFGQTFFSVQPAMIKSHIPVFTENKRMVAYLRTKYFGDIAMVVVAAACVGSIELTINSNTSTRVTKGEEWGTFGFGGSTIIMLVPRKNNFSPNVDVLNRTENELLETLVQQGDDVGKK